MARCTAPVRGHRTASAAADCPACGGRYGRYSSYGSYSSPSYGQQYNFQSTPLATFAQACAKRSMKLLLPDPTEREIKRHLRERTIEAMAALEGLRRKAPYLANWKGLTRQFGSAKLELFNAQNAAGNEWETFLKQFSVVRLGYTGWTSGRS